MRRSYLQADLARDLGLTPSAVSRLAKRGMPTHTLAAAEAWRRSHLHASWMKPPPRPVAASLDGQAEPGHAAPSPMLQLVATFAARAEADFAVWAEPLREAMRRLPRALWERVELPLALWDQLIGVDTLAILDAVQVGPADASGATATSVWVDALGEGEDGDAGCVYALACGLLAVAKA